MTAKYPLKEEARTGGWLLLSLGLIWIVGAVFLQGGLLAMPLLGKLLSPAALTAQVTFAPLQALFQLIITDLIPWIMVFVGAGLILKTESEIR